MIAQHLRCRSRSGEITTYGQEGKNIFEDKGNPLNSESLTRVDDESVAIEYIDGTGQVIDNGRGGLRKVIKALIEEGGAIR